MMERVNEERRMDYLNESMERVNEERRMDYLDESVENVLEKVKTARALAISDISADMRKMIDNPDYSDVVFLCKDGARVHAFRLFLVARSAVLHRMLMNGMTESRHSEIPLHEITGPALLPVMEFLYTGNLQTHAPKDWKSAYEIVGAVRFFLLKRLEFIAVDYLLQDAAKVRVEIEAAAKFLSMAVEFVGIFGKTVEPVALDLVYSLESKSLKPKHLQVLTGDAFRYFLENTANKSIATDHVSYAESKRLETIIVWCACQEICPKELLMSKAVPPEITSTLECLEKAPFEFMTSNHLEICQKIKPAVIVSIKQYLPLVNFRRIVPAVLVRDVEPMNIVSSSVLMDAFRFHALQASVKMKPQLQAPDKAMLQRQGWLGQGWRTYSKHTDMLYTMSKDGFGIQKTGVGNGFARYNLAIDNSQSDGFFEWEIIIKNVCDIFIEIGLHHDCDGEFHPNEYTLLHQPGAWVLRMNSRGCFINRRGEHQDVNGRDSKLTSLGKDCRRLIYGKDYGHKNSKVTVHLDLSTNRCTFSMSDDPFDEYLAWANLPPKTFFPAVSLGSGFGGGVRIRVLRK